MKLKDLNKEYDKLQLKYGSKDLDSIYNGGCETNPDICFVFMNPTGRNIASSKTWHGLKSPWIGTKNIWDLFEAVNLIDEELYKTIKKMPASSWTEEFAEEVNGEMVYHRRGVCESRSHIQQFCYKGSELTVTRVPISRVHGVWFMERRKYGNIHSVEYSKNMFTLNPYQELLYDENLETVYYL